MNVVSPEDNNTLGSTAGLGPRTEPELGSAEQPGHVGTSP